MKNNPQKIVEQIKGLLDELLATTGEKAHVKKGTRQPSAAIPKGASGALKILTDDGFFDTPQDISRIMEKLKEIGRYYPKTSISMNLLNLTKRREFSRIKDKETKNWLYVLRK
jgi:hypothetical protein